MKNYYKILGVKETASEEEIRQRWIELSKLYHPDLGEGSKLEEKIKEINEAYQMLKHSSTRVEYDLKRAYDHKKRGFNLKRLTLPISILIVFIIIGTIYFKMHRIPTFSKIVISNEVNQRNQTNQIDQINQIDQKKMAQKTSVASMPQHIDMPTQQPQVAPSTPALLIDPNQANLSRLPCNVSVQGEMQGLSHLDVKAPITQLPNDLITKVPDDPINQINQINLSREMRSLFHWDQIDPIDPKIEFVQFKPPSLIATEEEVRQFINNYIARYTQKDIHGFLSFFSSKAIQNQKDGLEGIRKIYTDFFNMSQELRYRIEEMKIEIYQNAVQVKARYEVNQILKKGEERKVWRGNIRWVLEREEGALKIISLDYQHEKSP
jgi:ketosteroid isomerase-like protein